MGSGLITRCSFEPQYAELHRAHLEALRNDEEFRREFPDAFTTEAEEPTPTGSRQTVTEPDPGVSPAILPVPGVPAQPEPNDHPTDDADHVSVSSSEGGLVGAVDNSWAEGDLRGRRVWILVDSGACTGVCEPGSFKNTPIDPSVKYSLRYIQGNGIETYGEKRVSLKLSKGRNCSMKFAATDATKNAMSVGEAVSLGNTVVFSPEGAYITPSKVGHVSVEKREDLVRIGNVFYLTGI